MIKYGDLNPEKKAVIFELDDVLFPKKDYDLQVFYLFANFMEYVEQFPPAQDMVNFMSKRYEIYGKGGMFDEVSLTFGIDKKYKENYERLYENARLPLKLLLYKEILEFMQELVINRKQIFIFTRGNAKIQLNKITQTEWNGLEKYLKVYYLEEFENNFGEALNTLLQQNELDKKDITFIGTQSDKEDVDISGVSFVSVNN